MKLKFLSSSLSIGFLTLIMLGVVFLSPFAPKARASSPSDVSITVSPENPAPNQNTTITLTSYVDDLSGISISWSVNGKSSLSGIGQTSFSLTAPALGQTTTVVATLALSDGDLNETIKIKPSIMTLLWQADDSYVPPFYEGKALPSGESEVKVVAIPEIKSGSGLVDPKTMLYSWNLDGTNDSNNSGYCKNYYTYVGDYLDASDSVDVIASTLDQQDSTEASIDVATTSPKIDFYKNDPILGTIWEQALTDGYTVTGNDIIQAAPYFISPQNIKVPFLTFTWSINNQEIPVPSYTKNMLPLAIQSGSSGASQISVEVDNSHSLVNTAQKEISVEF